MKGFRRTTLISVGCVSVLMGLALARKVEFSWSLWLAMSGVPFTLLKPRRITQLLVVIIIGLNLGLWRGGILMRGAHQLQALNHQRITIQMTASSDSIYAKNSQVQFTGSNIVLLAPNHRKLVGTFKVSGYGERVVYRGDNVEVSGILYPSRGANQATVSYAHIVRIEQGRSWYASLSRNFSAGMQNALPEPVASFAMGLLIGQRSTMPQDVLTTLTMVGLIHIVAVSGYNVTIIARAIARMKLPSRYQQLFLSLGFICTFVLVTGFSASIVRAALVSTLTLWAAYYGRSIKPVVLILFAAALTALINPFYVWGDLGWYLSFLAFFGVMILSPVITKRLFRRQPKLLTSVIIETLSAEIMTLPLIMMSFGQLSLVAIVANLLIVPLVPIAMLLSAVAGAAGMLAAPIAGWFALPARVLLTYMLDLAHILSKVPSEFLHLSISPSVMILAYCLILLMSLATMRRIRLNEKVIKTETQLS